MAATKVTKTTVTTSGSAAAGTIGYKLYQLISYVLSAVEAVLALRLILKMVGAGTGSVFVNFIYNLTYPLVYPFLGILPAANVSGLIFEWGTVIAMLIYALLAYGLINLIRVISPAVPESEEVVEDPDDDI